MTNSTPKRLSDLVERLYSVFSGYSNVELAPAAPLCPQDLQQLQQIREKLSDRALGELTAFDLLDYYYLAVEHIGSVDDLRHFLPRILDQIIDKPEILAPAHLPALLRVAGYAGWPSAETDIVAQYAIAAAAEGIMRRSDAAQVEEMARR